MDSTPKKPLVTFVLGYDTHEFTFARGPGVGKGTQCQLLLKACPNLVHLSAGELLRQEMATGSADAKIIDKVIKEGCIVPVKITCGLLKKAMKNAGWEVPCRFG